MFAMILMMVWQSAHTCRLFVMSYGVLSVLINLCIQWPVYRGTNRKTFLLPHSTNFVSGTSPASCICHTISSVWYGIQWSYNGLDHIENIAHTLPFTSIQMWHGHHYHNIVSHPLPFIIIQHFLWEPSYKLSNNIDVWYQNIACSIPKWCHAQGHVVEHFSMHPPFSCICHTCQ